MGPSLGATSYRALDRCPWGRRLYMVPVTEGSSSQADAVYYVAAANDDIEHAPSQGLHGFTCSPSAGATHERAEAGSVEALVHANPIGR